MVDPSAWTRWSKQGRAPAHIYRSLQWYMALIDKDSAWHPQNTFNTLSRSSINNELLVMKKTIQQLQQNLKAQKHTKWPQALSYFLVLCLGLLGGLVIQQL